MMFCIINKFGKISVMILIDQLMIYHHYGTENLVLYQDQMKVKKQEHVNLYLNQLTPAIRIKFQS